jgi:hypothetical protein
MIKTQFGVRSWEFGVKNVAGCLFLVAGLRLPPPNYPAHNQEPETRNQQLGFPYWNKKHWNKKHFTDRGKLI